MYVEIFIISFFLIYLCILGGVFNLCSVSIEIIDTSFDNYEARGEFGGGSFFFVVAVVEINEIFF
jgi:hypothetical protein